MCKDTYRYNAIYKGIDLIKFKLARELSFIFVSTEHSIWVSKTQHKGSALYMQIFSQQHTNFIPCGFFTTTTVKPIIFVCHFLFAKFWIHYKISKLNTNVCKYLMSEEQSACVTQLTEGKSNICMCGPVTSYIFLYKPSKYII